MTFLSAISAHLATVVRFASRKMTRPTQPSRRVYRWRPHHLGRHATRFAGVDTGLWDMTTRADRLFACQRGLSVPTPMRGLDTVPNEESAKLIAETGRKMLQR